LFSVVVAAFVLSGCNSGESRAEEALENADKYVKGLKTALNNGTVRNATIITQYAGILKSTLR